MFPNSGSFKPGLVPTAPLPILRTKGAIAYVISRGTTTQSPELLQDGFMQARFSICNDTIYRDGS